MPQQLEQQSIEPRKATTRASVDQLQWGTLRDWGQLVRLPNAFTLFSDCAAAAIVARGLDWPWTAFLPVVIASLFAYWAGMILNDVIDIDEDRRERPSRPLAAGKISPVVAGHIATGMLLVGPVIILVITTLHTSQPLWMGAAFLAAATLSLCVRSYNSVLKGTPLGPLLMGACRGLNILMVGCTLLAVGESAIFPRPLLALAAGIAVYILGLTIYAHREQADSSQGGLVLGLMLEVSGLVVLGCLPMWADESQSWTLDPARGYPLLIALIGLTVVNRGVAGVLHPVSRKVQLAVRHAILTLILLDAAIVLMWAGPAWGIAVVALLLPALASAVRFRST
jgi:4-hydroxybenzoate polyprenyltransferase